MRVFNPEKELNKIQKGNKNKIIIGVISLLLIIAIGSSYALYQIKYNKRIIYTTVDKFYSKDIQISVYIDNVKKEDFPSKEEGYLYEGIECENENVTANFNSETWELELKLDKPNRCNIKFTSNPFKSAICKDTEISECLLKKELQYNKELAYDDPVGNARYYGKDPANYIWFNCDDYSNPTEETCERWRIIGSFKNIEKVNADGTTTKENLVKIIRNESIGYMAWDNKPNGVGSSKADCGSNNWSDARLMMLLNPGYEDNELMGEGLKGSLYWNREDGKCIASTTTTHTSQDDQLSGLFDGSSIECNLGSKGLKEKTRTMAEYVEWDIGAYGVSGNGNDLTADQFYESERGEIIPTGYPAKWKGYVAIMYPSDFGFATSGNNSGANRDFCLGKALYGYDTQACYQKDWLYSSDYEATLLPYAPHYNYTDYIYYIAPRGFVISSGSCVWGTCPFEASITRPTLYLTNDAKITSGDGTYASPYVLSA